MPDPDVKVLYAKSYFQRELYALSINGQYTYVYASSDMNPGRKGRILPFNKLATPVRVSHYGDVPGYIYKEFYIDGEWKSHGKEPSRYSDSIQPFLDQLEAFLANHKPEPESYDEEFTYMYVLPIASKVNEELEQAVEGLEPFDWRALEKENA